MDHKLRKGFVFRMKSHLVPLAVLEFLDFVKERTVFKHVFVGFGEDRHEVVEHQNIAEQSRKLGKH